MAEREVSADEAGKTLAALVRDRRGLSWAQAKKLITSGKLFVGGARVLDPAARVEAGAAIEVRERAPRPRAPGSEVTIVYEDAHVVVIDKPSGVSSVPYERRETGTAMDMVRDAWRRMGRPATRTPLLIVHRIDKDTSGLLMFAKSKPAERGLGRQLRDHTIGRHYLCVAHGRVRPGRIESRMVRDRGDGLRGSTRAARGGKRAVTHVEVIEELPAATLCKVRLETGKTHQIRIHLAERGAPLVGERVYIRDFVNAGREPLPSSRLLLHAASLAFEHPLTGERIALESPLPHDFERALDRLRATRPSPGRPSR
jgi:23S rRNA pseudouridine1911/1915/1917 synthase